jgi:thiol-disulfide isomerase/thioredoxin
MRRPILWLALSSFVLLRTTLLLAEEEKILNIGDPAPAIMVSSWVKGDKVETFEPGTTYVVEFWATWCGPCKQVMPHLSELARRYKDKGVQIIGVNIWEHDLALVKPFMDEMGDKMDYTVALDKIPEGKTEMEGLMGATWMKAAKQDSIPEAFIIRDGKIQWIGKPTAEMDDVLAKIVAGTWDAAPAASERLAKKERLRDMNAKLAKILEAKDFRGALKLVDEESAHDESIEPWFRLSRGIWLCRIGEIDQAIVVFEKNGVENWESPGWLRLSAEGLLHTTEEGDLDPRVSKVALQFATRAVELTEEKFPQFKFQFLTTLADVQFRSGDPTSAATTEDQAIEAIKNQLRADTPALKQKLVEPEKRLEKFRNAATSKKNASPAQ